MAKLSPTTIDEHNWFYDDPDGLWMVHQAHGVKGQYLQTDQWVVPWDLVRAALARRDKRKLSAKRRKG